MQNHQNSCQRVSSEYGMAVRGVDCGAAFLPPEPTWSLVYFACLISADVKIPRRPRPKARQFVASVRQRD